MRGQDLLDEKIVYFMTAAEKGSFSAAARSLFVSQPAVSQQVASLERLVGRALLDRSGYRPTLTEAGRTLYEGVEAICLACDELVERMGMSESPIKVGFTGASQNRELIEFVRAFRAQHPDVHVDFVKDTFDGCRRRLLEGSVDCCFGISNTFRDLESVTCERLFDYEICVICAHDDCFASREFVLPSDLDDRELIVFRPEYGRLFYRDFMDSLRADGVRPHVTKSVSSLDELLLSVSMGEGVAVVSPRVVNDADVEVVPLRDSSARSKFVCAWVGEPSGSFAEFVSAAREFFSHEMYDTPCLAIDENP